MYMQYVGLMSKFDCRSIAALVRIGSELDGNKAMRLIYDRLIGLVYIRLWFWWCRDMNGRDDLA
jgi:hypothetical protein